MNCPDFLVERLRNVNCQKCRKVVHATARDIVHISMIAIAHGTDMRLFIEVACPRCRSRVDLHLERQEVQWTEMIWYFAGLVGTENWNRSHLMERGICPEDRGASLKCVSLLHVAPGRADIPGVGEPIAMISMGHDGEVEQPMLLKLRDAKSLAVALLGVLSHFDDDVAARIIEEHFPESLGN